MSATDIGELMASKLTPGSMKILRDLGRLADRRGIAAFIVGGVVRDVLMNVGSEDLDVVVEEPAEDFALAAARELGGEVKAHTRFGTAILVFPDGKKVDVATARSEAYERPGALPQVKPGRIEDDLRRRDFTINSMAMSINASEFGRLLDPHSGADDLKEGRLRVLTDHSFRDDPTRILRGIRFSARFGFEFDETTEDLLRESVQTQSLATVSGERLMNEIVLILKESDPWPPVSRLLDLGVFAAIEADWSVGPETERIFEYVGRMLPAWTSCANIDPGRSWMLYFLALLEPADREARASVLERLRAGRELRGLAADLAALEERCLPALADDRELKRSEIYRAAAPIDPLVLLLGTVKAAGTRAAERLALHARELTGVSVSTTGDALVGAGVPEGPAVGRILEILLDARLDGMVRSDEDELALAQRLAKNLDALNKN